jgi:hypothetical protein
LARYFQITLQKFAIIEKFGEIFPDKSPNVGKNGEISPNNSPKVGHHRKFWRDISR